MPIGIAIITFNRPDLCDRVRKSVVATAPNDAYIIVVNDGEPYVRRMNDGVDCWLYNEERKGVAFSKNAAIRHLRKQGCDRIFIIEDDVEILDSVVWQHYIDASNTSGIHHLNFQHNIVGRKPTITVPYPSAQSIDLFFHPEGAFSYFHCNLFDQIGVFDEQYTNAFEHVDLEYRLDKAGLAPPFWCFPDILNSENLLKPISTTSTITNREDYRVNWQASANHFVDKHGMFTSSIPFPSQEYFSERMSHLYANYRQS